MPHLPAKRGASCSAGVSIRAIRILQVMETAGSNVERHNHPKGPNFVAVVIAAGVALVLIFIIALVILSIRGKKDIPLNHKNTKAQIQWPAKVERSAEALLVCRL